MTKWLIIIPAAMLLCSCESLSAIWSGGAPETATAVLTDLRDRGTITPQQFDDLIAAYSGGGVRGMLGDAADIAIGALLLKVGIQKAPVIFGRKPKGATTKKA